MIAVDTNILVRYAVKDDHRQTVAATEFLKNNYCFIHKTVLLELAWVLSSTSGYNLSRTIAVERLRHICGLPTIELENPAHIARAIVWYEQGMDFGDALHIASSENLDGLATLDRKLSEKSKKLAIPASIVLIA